MVQVETEVSPCVVLTIQQAAGTCDLSTVKTKSFRSLTNRMSTK